MYKKLAAMLSTYISNHTIRRPKVVNQLISGDDSDDSSVEAEVEVVEG